MEIKEALECKKIAEKGITDIIREYEKQSGLRVTTIDLERIDISHYPNPPGTESVLGCITMEVKL